MSSNMMRSCMNGGHTKKSVVLFIGGVCLSTTFLYIPSLNCHPQLLPTICTHSTDFIIPRYSNDDLQHTIFRTICDRHSCAYLTSVNGGDINMVTTADGLGFSRVRLFCASLIRTELTENRTAQY
jgi:hypothetical protein